MYARGFFGGGRDLGVGWAGSLVGPLLFLCLQRVLTASTWLKRAGVVAAGGQSKYEAASVCTVVYDGGGGVLRPSPSCNQQLGHNEGDWVFGWVGGWTGLKQLL